MSEVPSPLVVLLDEAEAADILAAPLTGANQFLLNVMQTQLKNGKRRVALTDEQLGRVLYNMAHGTEPTHKLWLRSFRRPFKQMLDQVSDEPPARME